MLDAEGYNSVMDRSGTKTEKQYTLGLYIVPKRQKRQESSFPVLFTLSFPMLCIWDKCDSYNPFFLTFERFENNTMRLEEKSTFTSFGYKILLIVHKYYAWPDKTRSAHTRLFVSNVPTCRRKGFHRQLAHLSDLNSSHNADCISSFFMSHHVSEKRTKESCRSRHDNVPWQRNEGVQLGRVLRLLVEAARQISGVKRWCIIP